MADPLVTVVVAAYDAERWLGATLDSVLAQTMPDWRCHVVDDGSRDGTAELVRGYAARDPRFALTVQANAGVSAARNRLLEATRGEAPYVAVLDADDLWLPDALEQLVAVLDADPAAVGVQSLAEYLDEAGQPIRPGAHPAVQRRKFAVTPHGVVPAVFGTGMDFAQVLVTSGLYPPASMLFRRDALDRVAGYDESFRSQVDWEMYLRMTRSGHFAELDRQTAWYRIRPDNLTGDRAKVLLNQARLRRKTWEQTPPGAQRRAVEVATRYSARGRARFHAQQVRRSVRARRLAEGATYAALALWWATQSAVPRPPRPRPAVLAAVARAQTRLWNSDRTR